MNKENILTWIKNEFAPVELITESVTILQMIDNAVRHLNTHSAFRHVEMLTVSTGTSKAQVGTTFKTVTQVLPASPAPSILTNYPLWSLLGIAVLDNVTYDLVMMTEAFKNYKYYTGSDFRWQFERSSDPTVGGYLYMQNLPQYTTKVCLIGTKRFAETVQEDSYLGTDYDITDEFALQWLLYYIKSLVKQAEGNALRKSDIINIKNDGQALFNEGKEEKTELEQQLRDGAKWLAFCRRF